MIVTREDAKRIIRKHYGQDFKYRISTKVSIGVLPCSDSRTTRNAEEHRMTGIPNLDDCTTEDLDEYHAAFLKLANYCELQSKSRVMRAQGRIDDADVIERRMEMIYIRLPEWARW